MEMNICSFILSTGFSSNEYRPLHLKCCLCSFTTFFFCCCLHWKRRLQEGGCWGRQTCASAAFSFSLLIVAAWQQCYPLHHFSTVSIPGLSINVHQPHVHREEAATLLHCYTTCWGCCNCWTGSAAPFSVLPAAVPLLLTFTAHLQMTQCAVTQTFHIDQGFLS